MRSISVALILFSLAVAFGTPATAQSVRAVARGTVPEPGVPESVRSGLRADGFEISGFVPQLLTASDVNDAALVVSFDQDITKVVGIRVGHLKWDNLPGVLADYARGRDAIVSQLDALVDALARGDSP
jgi:protein-tyrosine-phosphatase